MVISWAAEPSRPLLTATSVTTVMTASATARTMPSERAFLAHRLARIREARVTGARPGHVVDLVPPSIPAVVERRRDRDVRRQLSGRNPPSVACSVLLTARRKCSGAGYRKDAAGPIGSIGPKVILPGLGDDPRSPSGTRSV